MTTSADIAARVGLEDPATFWEKNRKGRTTMLLLNVVAALADDWYCTVAAPGFADACRLQERVRELAERAGVEIGEGQLGPMPAASAHDLAGAGYFEPETKRALFTDHWKPGGHASAEVRPECLDEMDERTKAIRADQVRAARAAPPQLHRATRRTRQVTRYIYTGPNPENFVFQRETIHEVLADERNDRRVQARWVRVPAPQPTT